PGNGKWPDLLPNSSQIRLASLMLGALFCACAALFQGGCAAGRDTVKSQNRLDLAKDLLGKGEATGAESEAKKALESDPDSEEAHNILGLIYVTRARSNLQLMEKSDCLAAADASALRGEADDFMKKAAQHFTLATDAAPDYGEAWENRGVVAMY